MSLSAWASVVHKWLGLLVAVQIVLWIVSGLFFAAFPIERVRSEHRIAQHAPVALDAGALPTPADLSSLLPAAPLRLSYERGARGELLALAEYQSRSPVLIDLDALRVISPLDETSAREIARAHVAGAPQVREARLVTAETPEYRGALPAWRIAFEDAEGLAVYVAVDTGRVAARRSNLWRLYDGLWALHIMDWRDHENFNTGLLIAASLLSLITVIAGIVLLPYRLRLPRRRRRKAKAVA